MKKRRSRIKASALKFQKSRLKEDGMVDGKFYKAGTKLINGAKCPACGVFFPGALRVSSCGKCGYRSKGLKLYMEKRKVKEGKRLAYEKKQIECKDKEE